MALPAFDDRRTRMLTQFFEKVISGREAIPTAKSCENFLGAVVAQVDPATCVSKLKSNPKGLSSLQESLRISNSPAFLNGPAAKLLNYLQSPTLKTIYGGDLLRQVIDCMVNPSFFWDALVGAYRDSALDLNGQKAFAWLLLELVSLPKDQASSYSKLAEDPAIIDKLLNSSDFDTRVFGQKIKNTISNASSAATQSKDECAPGGRHDNDFADIRQIQILPTNDELLSAEPPFLRLADAIEDPCIEGSRLAVHLDSQFRLLREDMLGEMREELQVVLGKKKGCHRGTVLNNLEVMNLHFGPDDGASVKRQQPWGIQLLCKAGIPRLPAKKSAKERKAVLAKDKNILKNQSLTCLLINDKVIAFPTIFRDDDLMAADKPSVIVQIPNESCTPKTFLKLREGRNIRLVQINTSVFAFEPVLRRLQEINRLPLTDELIDWSPSSYPNPPPSPPSDILSKIKEMGPGANLQHLMGTPKPVHLDTSQTASLVAGLSQRVSLIQGPPGTGKSFIGALIAKGLYETKRILVVCYTNHALDQFLEDLMRIGIPQEAMVRLGTKSTPRTAQLSLFNQSNGVRRNRESWQTINQLESKADVLSRQFAGSFTRHFKATLNPKDVMTYIELYASEYFEAFTIPPNDDGMQITGRNGKPIDAFYLYTRWVAGQNAAMFRTHVNAHCPKIWQMPRDARQAKFEEWKRTILAEEAEAACDLAKEYNDCVKSKGRILKEKDASVLQSKRIIGCTTTAAAMYAELLQSASPEVLLVEEAGEILESHILTALGRDTQQLVLIGDHKQLRPKVNNYLLTVEKGEGYDLNRSMFERLVLKGFPHQTLSEQHRMRPEISALVRELTYPDLVDAGETKGRPDLQGFQDNLIFVNHSYPEDDHKGLANRDEQDPGRSPSKQNQYEADMVLKCVRYLGQQGYGRDKIVVLTPYLGQLQLLRKILERDNDPILNDLDSYELIRAGLMSAASATVSSSEHRIKLSTVDNYQGDQSDIVVVSMTRSNPSHDIGFMSSPERLNVLLSRARNALIMIGCAETFMNSKKSKELWGKFFEMLKQGKHIYEGFPIKCERHPDRTAILRNAIDFDEQSPDGGCQEQCGKILNCGLHKCPQRCHQIEDHSKMPCQTPVYQKCPKGHEQSWKCHKHAPATCQVCDREIKRQEIQKKKDFERKQREDAEIREHQQKMDEIEKQLEAVRQATRDEEARQVMQNALEQRKLDLENARAAKERQKNRSALQQPQVLPHAPSGPSGRSPPGPRSSSSPSTNSHSLPSSGNTGSTNTKPDSDSSGSSGPNVGGGSGDSGGSNPPGGSNPSGGGGSSGGNTPPPTPPHSRPSPTNRTSPSPSPRPGTPHEPPKDFLPKPPSPSVAEWQRQKDLENAHNDSIDKLMALTGLEEVKDQVLKIKARIDTSIRQGTDVKDTRFNVAMLGNPGTGKTTVARLYAQILTSLGALSGGAFKETTGASLANDGVSEAKDIIKKLHAGGGGALFLDEAYQLTDGVNTGGKPVLDYLLAEIENNVGKIVFIFAGYSREMEKFFEHNPGIPSRIPFTMRFADFDNRELLDILQRHIQKKYRGYMQCEDGMEGLYMRIFIRRLGRGRNRPGFGNARAVENVFDKLAERQAARLARERKLGLRPDDFWFTKEDIIGPDPRTAIKKSEAWTKLQEMVGLKSVKESVQSMSDRIGTNYQRELQELDPIEVPLNRVFIGSPGTGKTTVGKHYGQILVDLGLLSNGEVVIKNPSDFVGGYIGHSEKQTKAILAATVGKVLIIDEAYMLYSGSQHGGSGNHSNQFQTAVIDTIVAEVQSTPGEDRCVLLLGYEDKMKEMFQNVNPGLTRRFAMEDAFLFEDFNRAELRKILDWKLKAAKLGATSTAKEVASEVLDRASRRPNFGNAGEVENLLSQAKNRFQARQSKLPPDQRPVDIIFQEQDFDPEFDRTKNALINCKKLFEDVIGCQEVIDKLEGYQQVAINMKARGMDPRQHIPTNFVFKGPPGTGKTTTARKMGQVFYDMGFLSSKDVVECSASEMVGQYVGHTGPKVRQLLEKALGKVLFVDEAYRLAADRNSFASEAVDELVDLLTKEQFAGRIVVILAGYDEDMNRLMSINSGLSSRFPETIQFYNMTTEHCVALLDKALKKSSIVFTRLDDVASVEHREISAVFNQLSALPSWGNGRDVTTLGKAMMQAAFKNPGSSSDTIALTLLQALLCMNTMLRERRERATNVRPSRHIRVSPSGIYPPSPMAPPPQPTASTPSISTGPPTSATTPGQSQQSRSTSPKSTIPPKRKTPPPPPSPSSTNPGRDPGVSDAVWLQLQIDMRKQQREEAARAAELARLEELKRAEHAARMAEQQARDEAERRRLEEARLAAVRAREAAEQEARKKQEEERREKEAQRKLRQMGVCVAGFQWIKQASGYRCAGGTHFISDAQLGLS